MAHSGAPCASKDRCPAEVSTWSKAFSMPRLAMHNGRRHLWDLRKTARRVSDTTIVLWPIAIQSKSSQTLNRLLQRRSGRHTIKSSGGFRDSGMPWSFQLAHPESSAWAPSQSGALSGLGLIVVREDREAEAPTVSARSVRSGPRLPTSRREHAGPAEARPQRTCVAGGHARSPSND